MIVPALFASAGGDSLKASDTWFRGTAPQAEGASVPFDRAASSLPRGDDRSPAVVVDCDSLCARSFTEGVMKDLRVRGYDIWLFTWIETADDLFDAFNNNAEMVMGPCHAVASEADLDDIYSVSDSFVPVLYVRDGRPVMRRGTRGRGTLYGALGSLADRGFYRTCVLDTDGSVPDGDWSDILDGFPSAVPFTRSPPSTGATGASWICPLPVTRCRR